MTQDGWFEVIDLRKTQQIITKTHSLTCSNTHKISTKETKHNNYEYNI